MAKLSKTTKTVIIAAAVLLVLGAVLLVLVMTSPKDSGSSGTPPLFPGRQGLPSPRRPLTTAAQLLPEPTKRSL